MRTGRRRIGQHSAALQSLRSNQSSPASLFEPEFRRALPQQRRAYRRVARDDKLTANYPAFIQLASHQSGCGCILMSARAKAGTILLPSRGWLKHARRTGALRVHRVWHEQCSTAMNQNMSLARANSSCSGPRPSFRSLQRHLHPPRLLRCHPPLLRHPRQRPQFC